MTNGPLIRGIPYLPPGGRRVVTWGHYTGLRNALGDRAVTVTVVYRGKLLLPPWPRRLTSSCLLEVFSFDATDASDRNFSKQIADNIKAAGKSLDKIANRPVAKG